MKRRNFLATSLAAAAVPASSGAATLNFDNHESDQEIIELIQYTLKVGPQKNRVRDFYRDTAIPALNRAGIPHVGVFSMVYGPNSPSLYILIPHKSFESFLMTPTKLLDDSEYTSSGAEFLNAPLSDPMYVRMQTNLYRAFSQMPNVEVPEDKLDNDARIYEIRIYESHSRKYAKKKIEMFNEGGEIAIFKKTNLTPVFFGETIAGPLMPNLTYMCVFDNIEARYKNWDVFRNHPDWKKLSQDPQYKDTVSNITDLILRPDGSSQI